MAGLWWQMRSRLVYPHVSGVLLASAVGATLAFFVQHTGWYHQAFPAIALSQIAAFCLALDLLHAIEWNTAEKRVWAVAALCGVLAFAAVAVRKRAAPRDTGTITSELAAYPAGTTVYAFTVNLSHFTVILDHHLSWGSRFAHLWMMPAITRGQFTLRTGRFRRCRRTAL